MEPLGRGLPFKDDPEVAFCHDGGFIVKTKSKDPGKAWRLVEGAYVDR